jgi:preprotein translocase subunit SecD
VRRNVLTPLILIVVVAATALVATFATDSSPELGLDLQGGVSVVLAPTGDVDGERLDEAVDIIRTRVDALGVAEPEITRQGDAIVVQLPGVRNRDRALELVGQTAELRLRPVLQSAPISAAEQQGDGAGTTDTTGGDTTATTGEDTSATTGTDDTATDDTAVEGTSDETTATTGDEGAYGMTPGENAGVLLPQQETPTTAPADTASDDTTATTAPAGEPTDPTATTLPADPTQQPTAPIPEPTPREEDEADATVVLDGRGDDRTRYELGPTLATGQIVETASARLTNGQWEVSLTIRGGADGIDLFNSIASQCYNAEPTCPTGQLAIVLDSVVQSAPQIRQPSYSRDQISISGSFQESDARDLALVLRYGALPVELERQTVQTVSASLGEDSLRAGVIAGAVGVLLVAIYMVCYYRALGLVVIAGLTVWGSLLYAIISWLGATRGLALTLAGVTGVIVSIGVTVDSYVVFFERLKDEVRAGRTLRSSTERAFSRAFKTILAADISSFIGAAILWWLTVGSVRGFAFFLGLSTILDVVVAWFFTRPLVTWLSRSRVFTDMPVLGVARGLASTPPVRGSRGKGGDTDAAAKAPAGAGAGR